MSYILGALRKAEKERNGDAAPAGDWDAQDWNAIEERSTVGWGFKVAVVLVVVLLMAIFVLLWILIGNLSSEPAATANLSVVSSQEQEEREGRQELEQREVREVSVFSEESTDISYREPELVVERETQGLESSQLGTQASGSSKESVDLAPRFPDITGHLYFPTNTSLSRIFSGAGSFREGHIFEDGLRLVSISESQAVFEWNNERYEVLLGGY